MKKFNVWKTVTIGGFNSAEALLDQVEKHFATTPEIEQMVMHSGMELTLPETQLKLVKVSTWDLGLITTNGHGRQNDVRLKQYYERALELGLQLCPQDLAPQMCARREEICWRLGDNFSFASDPILLTRKQNPVVFACGVNDRQYGMLTSKRAYPEFIWHADGDTVSSWKDLVFVLPDQLNQQE